MAKSDFVRGFMEAAQWVHEEHDFVGEQLATMEASAGKFYDAHSYLWREGNSYWTGRDDYAGHDLYLTMEGHGTGFWDREDTELATSLSDLAEHWT